MGAGELLCLFLVVPDVFLVSGRRALVGPGAKPEKQMGQPKNMAPKIKEGQTTRTRTKRQAEACPA